MNTKLPIACFIILVAPLFFSCGRKEEEKNSTNAPASSLSLHKGNQKYLGVDTKESVVTWKGDHVGGINGHTGFVYLKKGELRIENGQLVGGTAEVDMTTIEDSDHGRDNNLVKHLKDPDFFNVENFPFSTITITRVTSINDQDKEVTADLTIKGITHPVTFPVRLHMKGGVVRATGKMIIDRTKWDVRFKSGKFFDNLKDQAISDDIEFIITLVAKNMC